MKFRATIPVSLRARFTADQPYVEQILFYSHEVDIQEVDSDEIPVSLTIAGNPQNHRHRLTKEHHYHCHDGRIYMPSDTVEELKGVLVDPCRFYRHLMNTVSKNRVGSDALVTSTRDSVSKLGKRIAELAKKTHKLDDLNYSASLRRSIDLSAKAELDRGETLRLHDAFDEYQRLLLDRKISGSCTYQQVSEPRATIDFGTGNISLAWSKGARKYDRNAPPTEIELPLSLLDAVYEIAAPIRAAIGRATPDEKDYMISVPVPHSFSQTFGGRELERLLKVLAGHFPVFQEDVWRESSKAAKWPPEESVQVLEDVIRRLEASRPGSPASAAAAVWLDHYEYRNKPVLEHSSGQSPRL